jgi:hypothetical protein
MREDFLNWLKNFPVESFSMVKGLMLENEGTFHGAVRFSPDKKDILSNLRKISAPVSGDMSEDASAKIKEAMLDLLGVPSGHRSSFNLGSSFSVEDANLCEVNMRYHGYLFSGVWGDYPTFYASVEKDGDENILLIGSKPKEVEKARKALRGSEGRMKIARRGPAEHKNFAQLNDAADGAMTKDLLDGLSFEYKAPASLEFSFDFPEEVFVGGLIETAPFGVLFLRIREDGAS